jgi:hypothetical protein
MDDHSSVDLAPASSNSSCTQTRIPILSTCVLVFSVLVWNTGILWLMDYLSSRSGYAYGAKLAGTVGLISTAGFAAQVAIAWLWLQRFVVSLSVRVVLGIVICHTIVVAGYIAMLPGNGRFVLGEMLLSSLILYSVYWIHGICLEAWLRIMRLKALWVYPGAVSRFAMSDLFCWTSVAAVLMGELVIMQKASISLGGVAVLFAVFSVALVLFGASCLIVLGLGSFFAQRRLPFAIFFVTVTLLGPTGCMFLFNWFTSTGELAYYIDANILTWSYVIAVLSVFPLISPPLSQALSLSV